MHTSELNISQRTGTLKVEVFDTSVAALVQGAEVTVSLRDSDSVISSGTTDISGQTEPVELAAPPESYSLDKDADRRPYSEYDLTINAEGYNTEFIKGVQVYPGAEAIQRVFLGNNSGVVTVTPPTLWGDYPEKLPEDEVKELPPETGFVVLDKVSIPETIVVHTGVPNSDAPNYYVPYKDYIKNVASSEIYSTWPAEAIKANVLAINSFTLNRVFTEWYRSRGYNFTITNSTAYDQYFSYGRTIYKSISDIVDELFTTYIKREGQRQPLFAQYCDGKNVQCPGWMTQWGSAELAMDGMRAIEILRYFYGDDIYLDAAERVTGIPVSYPGTELSLGSTGSAVRAIQRQLNKISSTYSAIPKIKVDGIYGQATKNAVEIFQGIFNLPVTGVTDFATWYDISEIYVAVERLAAL